MINKRLPIRDEDHVFICCVLVGIMKYARLILGVS